jgi:hypothetical protein
MIDTRAVAQEVQDQLMAAMNKGQERVRKAQEQVRQAQEQARQVQEQVRKSRQEQVRKSREAVTGAIRTGNELARAFRPNIPALPVPGLRVPSLRHLTDPAKLRASAQELADQMIATQRKVTGEVFASQRKVAGEVFATQRKVAGQFFATQRSLADKAFQAASPLVADGVTRLSKAVATLQDGRKTGHADSGAHLAAVPPVEETEVAEAPAEHAIAAGTKSADDTKSANTAGTKPAAAEKNSKASKTRTAKTAGSKPSGTTAGTSRPRTAKPDTPKK